jgi:hypothetical protein
VTPSPDSVLTSTLQYSPLLSRHISQKKGTVARRTRGDSGFLSFFY